MSDRYQSLIHTPVGQLLAKNLGLPNPVTLDRGPRAPPSSTARSWSAATDGSAPPCLRARRARHRLGHGRRGRAVQGPGVRRHRHRVLGRPGRAPTLLHPAHAQPDELRRVVVLGTPPESTNSTAERVAQRALEGFTQLPGQGDRPRLDRPAGVRRLGRRRRHRLHLGFPLSPKSAYVAGQVVRIGVTGATAAEPVEDWTRPSPARSRSSRAPARHRRADRLGAAPRRRDGPRRRRTPVPPASLRR